MDYELLTENLIENMPEVSEHVIESEGQETGQEMGQETPDPPLKATGSGEDIFNPEIHCVDAHGQPVRTKAGGFRKRPGRTKVGSLGHSKASAGAIQGGNVHANESIKPQISREELAKSAATKVDFLYWHLMGVALPCAAIPILKAELSEMAVDAVSEGMLESEEIPNVPWYVMALGVYVSATMAILNAEENKPRILSIKDRIILFFAKRRKGQAERAS